MSIIRILKRLAISGPSTVYSIAKQEELAESLVHRNVKKRLLDMELVKPHSKKPWRTKLTRTTYLLTFGGLIWALSELAEEKGGKKKVYGNLANAIKIHQDFYNFPIFSELEFLEKWLRPTYLSAVLKEASKRFVTKWYMRGLAYAPVGESPYPSDFSDNSSTPPIKFATLRWLPNMAKEERLRTIEMEQMIDFGVEFLSWAQSFLVDRLEKSKNRSISAFRVQEGNKALFDFGLRVLSRRIEDKKREIEQLESMEKLFIVIQFKPPNLQMEK